LRSFISPSEEPHKEGIGRTTKAQIKVLAEPSSAEKMRSFSLFHAAMTCQPNLFVLGKHLISQLEQAMYQSWQMPRTPGTCCNVEGFLKMGIDSGVDQKT